MKCGCCGENKRTYDQGMFESTSRMKGIWKCESCGAQLFDGIWKKVCNQCGKDADKLYDLFVPHHCKKCSDELHEEAIQKKDYCLICGALRIDCCC